MRAVAEARLHDPFSYLGLQREGGSWILRVFLPHASQVWAHINGAWTSLQRTHPQGLFAWEGTEDVARPYRLRYEENGQSHDILDPYAFPPLISAQDLYLFNEGRLLQAYRMLGAHVTENLGVRGVRFAVWAPNAERVSVVGDFNHWDGRVHPMRVHGSSGVWELFLPGLAPGALYKFEIRNRHSGRILVKADPYACEFELRPGTAAKVSGARAYDWRDGRWMRSRAGRDWQHTPLNCYEVHLGSWRRHGDGNFLTYRQLADTLIPYVKEMGHTHVELMPICEHPLDRSWGYQTTGYFAVTSRYGTPEDFRAFVDACHSLGIGVILDWTPAHFPRDDFALAGFDGTALYEHKDPRRAEHPDWGTYIFNYGRNEVRSFLLSSAHFWLSEFHIDGLRVDAVASMLYLDYSRKKGQWLPNRYGGRENLEAIHFLRELNVMAHEEFPGALTIAEESTAWPMVSRPTYVGGLGFSMKWNMGWMNDTLVHMGKDPVYRRYHHNQLTFGQLYAYSENFVLPLSHDEVVHGKASLLDKMPGDPWQRFANVRLLFTYQMTHPGKKLNFMGNEFACGPEWQAEGALDWGLLDVHWHRAVQALCRDLNRLYRDLPALHELDFSSQGFSWIDCHDAEQSVLSYLRRARDGASVVVVLNLTPVPRHGYRIGVPQVGYYREVLNSDSIYYGGSNVGNGGGLAAEEQPWMGYQYSLALTLPPLAGIILCHEPREAA